MRTLNSPFNWNTAATLPSKMARACAPGFPLNINSFIVQLHITESFNGILSIAAGYDIRSGYRHRKFSTVGNKATGQFTICLAHRKSVQWLRLRFGSRSGFRGPFAICVRLLAGCQLRGGLLPQHVCGRVLFLLRSTGRYGHSVDWPPSLLVHFALQTFLFLLQISHQCTLLFLLSFQFRLFVLTFFQQSLFGGFHLLAFCFFLPYLLLLL